MRRLLAFEHHLFASAGSRRDLGEGIFAVLAPDLPLLFEVNQVVVEARVEELGGDLLARDLIELSERVFGEAGLTHRRIRVESPHLARRVATAFDRAGWCRERHLAMVWRRPLDRWDQPGVVREVSQEEYEPLETALLRQYSSSEPVVRQLLDLRRRYAAAVGGRFFAGSEGGQLVSGCEVWSWEGTAEIDAVGTLSGHRRKGLARAVVSRAVLEASRTADLVFLFADDEDWPKALYAKLGFRPVGLVSVFTLPPPSRVADERS